MKVRVYLTETAQPIELVAANAYTKGPMYCVYLKDETVQKFPVSSIFRVVEDYGKHS
jgi:hypothetical protein